MEAGVHQRYCNCSLFLLVVLSLSGVAGESMRMDSFCNTEQCHPNSAGAPIAAAATATAQEIAPERACLMLQSSAKRSNMRSLSLLQEAIAPSRKKKHAEEEPQEEPIVVKHKDEEVKEERTMEEMGEEKEFKMNHIAGNHSDNTTSRGLQPVSQSQVLSHGSAFDANLTIALVDVSSHGSWLSNWIGLPQLSALCHSKVMSMLRSVTPAFMRTGDDGSWQLSAALLLVASLVCVCFSGMGIASSAGTDNGTIRPLQAPPDYLMKARSSHGGVASRSYDPMAPSAAPVPPVSRPPLSVGQTSALALPISPPNLASTSVLPERGSMIGEADAFLCPDLVVPLNCESILRVPIDPQGSLHVTDLEGNNLVRVELYVGKHELRRVVLTTSDGIILAQCVATPMHSSADEFQLLRASGSEHFATLVQGGPDELNDRPSPEATWIVRTRAGAKWFFHGQFDIYTVDVTDNHGRMQAVAYQGEQTLDQHSNAGKFFFLRVAPMMDISVALLGLLAVNHLMRP